MRCFSNDENDPVDPDLCAVPVLLPTDHDVVSHPRAASLKLQDGLNSCSVRKKHCKMELSLWQNLMFVIGKTVVVTIVT